MITNERQYKITRASIASFQRAIDELDRDTRAEADIDPRLARAQREALESQLQDIKSDLTEYEALRASTIPVISADSIGELATALIKARISSGLSQKALAERLGLKEQQVQRYEAERYRSASFRRLQDIANAIGITLRSEVSLLDAVPKLSDLEGKLRDAGVHRGFLSESLLSSEESAQLSGEVPDANEAAIAQQVTDALQRIFGWSRGHLLGSAPLTAPRLAAEAARFKVPAGKKSQKITVDAAYANYLSVVALKSCRQLTISRVPQNPVEFARDLLSKYGEMSLRNALHFCWDLGIPVLPLKNHGSFHGACWRYEYRNVIVLKQTSKHESRWLFDLLHEVFHAGQSPELETLEVLEDEETSLERRTSPEEMAASSFAGDVVLSGRASELAEQAVALARGAIERLKSVVPTVAKQSNVPVGQLANYLAFRLSWQGINWWGAANNLQPKGEDPWRVTRDVFFERFPFKFESALDRKLLERALQ